MALPQSPLGYEVIKAGMDRVPDRVYGHWRGAGMVWCIRCEEIGRALRETGAALNAACVWESAKAKTHYVAPDFWCAIGAGSTLPAERQFLWEQPYQAKPTEE